MEAAGADQLKTPISAARSQLFYRKNGRPDLKLVLVADQYIELSETYSELG